MNTGNCITIKCLEDRQIVQYRKDVLYYWNEYKVMLIDHTPTSSGKVVVWVEVDGVSAWRLVYPVEITDKPPLRMYKQLALFDNIIPFPVEMVRKARKAA